VSDDDRGALPVSASGGRHGTEVGPQEVEVAALVWLKDVLVMQPAVASPRSVRSRPCLAAGELRIAQQDMDRPGGDVELDLVAVLYQSDGPSRGSFGGDV
jgi:hypothetical protein